MYRQLCTISLLSLFACGLPTELEGNWRGNIFDESKDPEADPVGPGVDAGGIGGLTDAGDRPPATCGNGVKDPEEDCDSSTDDDFPCGDDCQFVYCGSDAPEDGAGDGGCGDPPNRCIRIAGQSICALTDSEADPPGFIKEPFSQCYDNGNGMVENDEPVRCHSDQECQDRYGGGASCSFDIPDELRGLCIANSFNPEENWDPKTTPILLGWWVELPGEEAPECYPMACDSDDGGDPGPFCQARHLGLTGDARMEMTCIGDLALDSDGDYDGPSTGQPLEGEICVYVECFPEENENGINQRCRERYLLEDATCSGEGFCMVRNLLLFPRSRDDGGDDPIRKECAQHCRSVGGPGPDPMLLCHENGEGDEVEVECRRCSGDNNCPNGFHCEVLNGPAEGFCRRSCGGDEDCPRGQHAVCENRGHGESLCYPRQGGHHQRPEAAPCDDRGNDCGQDERCEFGHDGGNGRCLPNQCGTDHDCPNDFFCILAQCAPLEAHRICEEGHAHDCGGYLTCRDIGDPRPACVTEGECHTDQDCDQPLRCHLGRCFGMGDGCERVDEVRWGRQVCDVPARQEPQRCLPQEEDQCQEGGANSCVGSRGQAEADENEDVGVCTDGECDSSRDCPWGQFCLQDEGHCVQAVYCSFEDDAVLCGADELCVAHNRALGDGGEMCLMHQSCEDNGQCRQAHPSGHCANNQCVHPGHCGGLVGFCLPTEDRDEDDYTGNIQGAVREVGTVGSLPFNDVQYAHFNGTRDADIFKFTAPQDGSFVFSTERGTNRFGNLLSENGNLDTACFVVQYKDENWRHYGFSDDGEDSQHCAVHVDLEEDDEVFLVVYYFEIWEEFDEGLVRYEVHARCAEENCEGGGNDDDHGDRGDPSELGEVDGETVSVNAEINFADDADAFSFRASEEGAHTIRLSNASPSMYATLLNPQNANLGNCSVAAGGDSCEFESELSANTTYRVEIKAFGGATGTYSLEIVPPGGGGGEDDRPQDCNGSEVFLLDRDHVIEGSIENDEDVDFVRLEAVVAEANQLEATHDDSLSVGYSTSCTNFGALPQGHFSLQAGSTSALRMEADAPGATGDYEIAVIAGDSTEDPASADIFVRGNVVDGRRRWASINDLYLLSNEDDVDWYRFRTDGAGNYELKVMGSLQNGELTSHPECKLYVGNNAADHIQDGTINAVNRSCILDSHLEANSDYWVKVTRAPGIGLDDALGRYRIEASHAEVVDDRPQDCGAAADRFFLDRDLTITGNLHHMDIDYIQLRAAVSGRASQIAATLPPGGTVVQYSNTCGGFAALPELLTLDAQNVVYLKVHSTGNVGDYEFDITAVDSSQAANEPVVLNREDEANQGRRYWIAPNERYLLSKTNDIDWFRLLTDEDGTYEIKIDGDHNDAHPDSQPACALYHNAGNAQIQSGTVNIGERTCRIERNLSSNTEYLVKVAAHNGAPSSLGRYRLGVSRSELGVGGGQCNGHDDCAATEACVEELCRPACANNYSCQNQDYCVEFHFSRENNRFFCVPENLYQGPCADNQCNQGDGCDGASCVRGVQANETIYCLCQN